MPDAPELLLNRTLALFLDAHDLAVYDTERVVERGIRLDGVMPTTVDEFTLLTPLAPVADGRANMTYRVQFYTRRVGSPMTARIWASQLRAVLDHRAYTPNVLGISWSQELSSLDIAPDSQGRSGVACTYTFRGRR